MTLRTAFSCAVFLSCAHTAGAFAQTASPARPLGLAECRELALRNNVDVLTAALESAAARRDRARAITSYFPVVDAGAMYLRADKDLFEMRTAGGNLPVYDGNPMNIPAATQFAYLPASTVSMLHGAATAWIDISQPVFAGGRIVNGNRLAALGTEVRSLQERLAAKGVALRAEELYWNAVTLREKCATLDGYASMLDEIERQTADAVAAGLALKNDLLKVQLEQSGVRLKRSQAGHGYTLAMMALCRHAGLAYDSAFVPADTLPAPGDPAGYRIDHAAALAQRDEFALLGKAVEAEELKTGITRGEYLPSLAVGVTGRYIALDDNAGKTFGAVFAALSVPISQWWGGAHAIERQSLNEDVALTRLRDGKELLLLQMEKARLDLDDAWRQHELSITALAQAQEQLRINADSHARGLSTLSDLLEAQAALQHARDQHIEARARCRTQLVAYLQCTGR